MEHKEIEQLSNLIIRGIEANRPVESEDHVQHHKFIEILIVKAERRSRFWEAIRKQVAGWGIIMVISGIGYAVWQGFAHFVHKS